MSGAAAFAGYNLLIKAPQSLANDDDPFVARKELGVKIDELAPDYTKPGAAASDPNISQHKANISQLGANISQHKANIGPKNKNPSGGGVTPK